MKTLILAPVKEAIKKPGSFVLFGEICEEKHFLETLKNQSYKFLKIKFCNCKTKNFYKKLNSLYEKTLAVFAYKLNKVHKTNLPITFWRILIGPWLYHCISIFFEKKTILNFKINTTTRVRLAKNYPFKKPPINLEEIFSVYLKTPDWHYFWNSFILKKIQKIKNKSFFLLKKNSPETAKKCWQLNFFSFLKKNIFYNIKNTYNSLLFEIFLILFFGKIKALKIRVLKKTNFSFRRDAEFQKEIKKGNLLYSFLWKEMPQDYLESFAPKYKNSVLNCLLKKPLFFLTSNCHLHDDQFKLDAAVGKSMGVPLVIGQHGAGPEFKHSMTQDHEKKIADLFLNPIFERQYKQKCISNSFNYRKKTKTRASKNLILLVIWNPSLFFYEATSSINIYDFNKYLKELDDFMKSLDFDLQQSVTFRITEPPTYQPLVCFLNRWKCKVSSAENEPINKALKNSKIIICTYMATLYAEILATNKPVFMFWNPKIFYPKHYASKDFSRLKSAKVFFETGNSCAKFINKNTPNIFSVWNSPIIQNEIIRFSNKYAQNKVIDKIKTVLFLAKIKRYVFN